MKTLIHCLIANLLVLSSSGFADTKKSQDYFMRDDVQAFAQEMVEKHQFSKAKIREWLGDIEEQKRVLELIAMPYEAKPWYQYHPIFVTDKRAKKGLEFWNQHQALIHEVSKTYKIPPEIIIAILGVETYYGKHTGKFKVLDAVATLAFGYPKRAKFFKGELEQLLLLIDEQKINPSSLRGSYAGAMGQPQFIASSYRHYAVDYDKDGHKNLISSTADVLASVANYFSEHKWNPGEPIAYLVKDQTKDYSKLVSKKLVRPKQAFAELEAGGIGVNARVSPEQAAFLIALDKNAAEKEYWVGFNNFYVITRYNRSIHYAMAVFQLAEKIKQIKTNTTLVNR